MVQVGTVVLVQAKLAAKWVGGIGPWFGGIAT